MIEMYICGLADWLSGLVSERLYELVRAWLVG